jgi:ribosomal protein L29
LNVKAKQLREMTLDELQGSLADLEKRLFELRSQAVTEKLENSKGIINVRGILPASRPCARAHA